MLLIFQAMTALSRLVHHTTVIRHSMEAKRECINMMGQPGIDWEETSMLRMILTNSEDLCPSQQTAKLWQ